MKQRFLRFPGGAYKAVTFSYDDGAYADIRLAEIFNKYRMKATFNINSYFIRDERLDDFMTFSEVKEYFLNKGHEVAVHGKYHLASGLLRPIDGIKEVIACREELEARLGVIIRGMAYSGSGITQFENGASYGNIKNYLKDLDIAYSRTLGGDNDGFRLPADWYAWMPSAHHNNENVFGYIDKFVGIDDEKSRPLLMYIWGHSREFDSNGNWERIEDICSRLSGKEDMWYATNMEIYEYVNAYNSLIFSADGATVYNPTSTEVCFYVAEDRLYSVKPGETIITERQ